MLMCLVSLAACTPKKDGEESSQPSTPGNGGQGQPPGNGTTNPPSDGTTNPPGGGTTNPPGDGTTNPPGENGETIPPVDTCIPVNGTVAPPSVSLNQGASSTNSTAVYFEFQGEEILKMKISDNDSCKCGTWEKFAQTKDWTLKQENSQNHLSVQFKDYEGRSSQCVKLSILHDSLPPAIAITLDSLNSYETGKDTKLNLSVSDPGVGTKTVNCTLNTVATNCSAGSSVLTFPSQQNGAYTFIVTATDNLGHSSSQSTSWNVTTPFQQVTQNHEIKSNNKVDILLVDDNSASMEYEQESMAKRMSTFMSVLAGLDWRIAITTTDPTHNVWGDGRLLDMKGLGKQNYISSETDPKKAQKALEDTIQRSEIGNSSEQGIFATYRAVERSLNSTDPNAQFFRNDANFATVVISDEDESAKQMRNIPENLLSFVQKTWPAKNFAFHSIINRSGDTQCKNTYGNTYGATYEKMSRLTGAGMVGGAIIGSVCESDYGSQLKGIGDSVQAMQKIIDLQCTPIGDVNSSVVVLLNGSNYTSPYTVNGTRLVFQTNLPVGKYVLQYSCVK